MAVLIRKNKGNMAFTGLAKLSITAFIASLGAALYFTVWSIYLDSFLHNASYVGFIEGFLTCLSLLSFFIIVPFIERHNKSKIYMYSLLMLAITFFMFTFITNIYLVLIVAIFMVVSICLRITSFGIIVKDKSSERNLSRNEGLLYTFLNIAFLVGPLIAGYIAYDSGVRNVFLIVSALYLSAFIFFRVSEVKDAHINKKPHDNMLRNLIDFFKSRDRLLSYILSGGVNLWWTLIYIYMPIFIIRAGLGVKWVGWFLFGIVAPLVLVEYKASKLAGKIGSKKIFAIGFFITSMFGFACFFVSNVHLILGLLILASFGMGFIEPTTEAYFFDILKKNEELRFYGPYNTTIDAHRIFGSVIGAILLTFLPFRYLFILFASMMFIYFMLSFKVRNVIERRRDGKKNQS